MTEMESIIAQFVADISRAAEHAARKKLITEIANGNAVPRATPKAEQRRRGRPPGPTRPFDNARALSVLPASIKTVMESTGESRTRTLSALNALKAKGLVKMVGIRGGAVWHRMDS